MDVPQCTVCFWIENLIGPLLQVLEYQSCEVWAMARCLVIYIGPVCETYLTLNGIGYLIDVKV